MSRFGARVVAGAWHPEGVHGIDVNNRSPDWRLEIAHLPCTFNWPQRLSASDWATIAFAEPGLCAAGSRMTPGPRSQPSHARVSGHQTRIVRTDKAFSPREARSRAARPERP